MCVAPGPLHGANAALSKRHSKVPPASVAWKPKVGVWSGVVPDGPESMIVSGGVVSTVKVRVRVVAFPAASVSLT